MVSEVVTSAVGSDPRKRDDGDAFALAGSDDDGDDPAPP
jgi:hypothetical protein